MVQDPKPVLGMVTPVHDPKDPTTVAAPVVLLMIAR
jgi:hypothetical protein